MAANPYAAGTNVYNGGSNSANRGQTLDPMGYIDRSQNRSGLAQAALNKLRNRMSSPGMGIDPGPVAQEAQPIGLPPSLAPSPMSPLGVEQTNGGDLSLNDPTAPAPATFGASQPIKGTAKPAAPAAKPAPVPSYLQVPTVPKPVVTSTSTGKNYISLPFDYDLSDQRAQGVQQDQYINHELDDQLNQLMQQNYSQRRDLASATKDQGRADLNGYAGRGLAFSSGYGNQVARTNQKAQRSFDDLETALGLGKNSIRTQRNAADKSLLTLLRTLARAQTERNKTKA